MSKPLDHIPGNKRRRYLARLHLLPFHIIKTLAALDAVLVITTRLAPDLNDVAIFGAVMHRLDTLKAFH